MDRLLAVVFFLSGLASLVYQVAWQRVLTLHYGVGPISITIIVSVYMFGLGLGALVGGRIAERVRQRLLMYMILEFLLGGFGLFSLFFIGWLGWITAGSPYLVTLICMFALLSFPTLLMGMTLPLLVKAFSQLNRDFLGNVSRLYFLNTLGAASGALLASYVLISFGGLDSAVIFAAVINFLLVMMVVPVRTVISENPGIAGKPASPVQRNDLLGWIAYPSVFLAGFLAIGYEIVWFRIISVLTKASAYAFSTSLAVYLTGIAVGSYLMGTWLRHRSPDKKSLFFLLQFAISIFASLSFTGFFKLTQNTAFAGITSKSFDNVLHPLLNVSSYIDEVDYLGAFLAATDVFLWPAFFMFIPTLLMGASFPLISHLALVGESEEGKTVGQVYFFNTAGNVTGGLVTGFVLLVFLGTEQTLLLFTAVGCCFLLFASSFRGRRLSRAWRILLLVLTLATSAILFPGRTEFYRVLHSSQDSVETFIAEGTAGVVVTGWTEKRRLFTYINGLGHGGRPSIPFYVEALEAASLAKQVRTALVIGYGTGSITEALLKLEDLKTLTLVEINPVLMRNLNKLPLFQDLLSDPRIQLVLDDGRRYLLRSEEKFDLVIMDPLRSTTSHSNNIYSKDFFELVGSRLNPGGVLSVWMDEYRVLPKTLASAFDYIRTYDYFTVASDSPMQKDEEYFMDHVTQFPKVRQRQINRRLGTYLGDRTYVEKVAKNYPINTDFKPVCEYYLGLQLKRTLQWLKDPSPDDPYEWPSNN